MIEKWLETIFDKKRAVKWLIAEHYFKDNPNLGLTNHYKNELVDLEEYEKELKKNGWINERIIIS